MKKLLFPFLITLSALAVSCSAAFYSVFGLSKLFAGASTEVIIMAGSLEFAKLVVASLLYQYWDTINKWLRSYLAIACFVLMIITSGGIYGFLSGAYQSTATKSELLDKSLLILEQKQVRFEESKEDLTLEKTQINQSISDLRTSLSNPHSVSWYDKNSETVITSSSGSARRALQAELKTTIFDRDNLNLKLEAVLDSINKTDMALLEKEISNEDQRELGPLKYLASTTGWPMDKVVNYFLLLIVFVFDPLAIALVVAANMAFAQIRKPKETAIEEHVDDDGLDEEDEPIKEVMVEEDNTTEPFESLKQRVKENQEKLKEESEWDKWRELQNALNYPTEEEERMNIIGQNGNDGLHYDEEYLEKVNQSIHKELWEEEKLEEPVIPVEPINPTEKDLERLEKFLKLDNENKEEVEEEIPLDRLTDTTQTLATEENTIIGLEKDVIEEKNYNTLNENKSHILDVNGHKVLRYRKYR